MVDRELVYDQARFAKACFWGAAVMVLRMHDRGQIDADEALRIIREAHDVSEPHVTAAEKLLKQLTDEILKNDLSPL